MQNFVRVFLVAAASGATVYAQTFSSCNPVLKSGCSPNPALGKAVEYDFTKGAPDDFTVSTGSAPTFGKDGASFAIAKSGDAPTLSSKWYMMFGHYEIVLKTAKGVGTVSSVVLQSDDLDEVDWEWLGADAANVQTNYYGKGNTAVYDRGQTLPDAGNQDDFHTYSLDWTADAIVWSIDGKQIRKLTPQTADKDQYPQSPMQLKLGTWAGGDPAEPEGTIQWAGGKIDYTKGPYTMVVKSVKAIDYSTGKTYSYGDQSGTWQSIRSDGGKINSKGDPNAKVSEAPASGTAVQGSATTAAKLDNPVASGSAPPTVSVTGTAVATANATNGTKSMTTVISGSTVVAPYPTGNATAPNASGSGSSPASTTGAGSSSGGKPGSSSSGASGSSASNAPATANVAGSLGASAAGTGLVVMLAAALLM